MTDIRGLHFIVERAGRFHRRNQFRVRLVGGNNQDILVGEPQPNHDDCLGVCREVNQSIPVVDTTGLA